MFRYCRLLVGVVFMGLYGWIWGVSPWPPNLGAMVQISLSAIEALTSHHVHNCKYRQYCINVNISNICFDKLYFK